MTREQRERVRQARSAVTFAELEAVGGYWCSNGHGPEFCIDTIEQEAQAAKREIDRAIDNPEPDLMELRPGRAWRRCKTPGCGITFEPRRRNQEYHDEQCSNTYRKRLSRALRRMDEAA